MHKPALFSTAALMMTAVAHPALADLSAAEAWAEWKSFASYTGQSLTADSELASGDTLTVSGITIGSTSPDVEVVGRIARIEFRERDDGTVAVNISPEIPIEVTGENPEGDTVTTKLNIALGGGGMVISGSPGSLSHDYQFDRMAMDIVELTENGRPVDIDMSLALQPVSGVYGVAGNAAVIRNDSNIGALAFRLDASIPEEDADFEMTMTMTDIVSESTGTISSFDTQQNLAVALRNGQFTEGTLSHGPATFSIDTLMPEGRSVVTARAASGTMSGGLNRDGVNYESSNSDVELSLVVPGAMIPPIELSVDRMSGALKMPLVADDDAKPLGFSTRLEGVTASDTVWSMIDPMKGLPRTPATLIVELSGMGRWLVDVMDPEAIAALEDRPDAPGEIETVTLDNLTLSVAGAELTGTGQFAFDNATVPPVPSGVIDLNMTGANALIDGLVNIGLIPEDQAMGARMMLGLFARPGSGPDNLTSKIELGRDGSVTANGQRIK